MSTMTRDIIPEQEACTLPGLFRARVERTPQAEAYRQYDRAREAWVSYTWEEIGQRVARWRRALHREGLAAGERVAILLENSVEWVCLDQAALSLGLVTVPLYTTDNPENLAYILGDAGASLLLVGSTAQWAVLVAQRAQMPTLKRVLCLRQDGSTAPAAALGATLVADWLAAADAADAPAVDLDPQALATLVYTSGTTGRPKGVMLSHHNILSNLDAVLARVPAHREDVFLSFLPLSHAFERTTGYYLPMAAGSCVAYARSVKELPQDLLAVHPTVLVSVPRIYERVYARLQEQLAAKGALALALFRRAVDVGWRRFLAAQHRAPAPRLSERLLWSVLRRLVAAKILARLGGRLRVAVTGGAPMSEPIARCFLGLGVPLLQGYGLTETAPVVSANTLEDNIPESVGRPLPGVELRLGAQDELLVRGPNVMLGYWNRPQDTRAAIDAEGWLHTGDQARLEDGRVYIRGRLKEIIVMSTGEKIAPADLELAVTAERLFDQAMVVGEGKPFLAVLLVLNPEAWREQARALRLSPDDSAALAAPPAVELALTRAQAALRAFPRHAQPHAAWLTLEPWTIDNGLITPTLKLKRPVLEQRFAEQIRALYAGHAPAA